MPSRIDDYNNGTVLCVGEVDTLFPKFTNDDNGYKLFASNKLRIQQVDE